MEYGLESLWNKGSSIIYSAPKCKKLRDSQSLEENGSFLVRWAGELFAGWATWMQHILPGCKVGHKSNSLRIVTKIKEMKHDREIKQLSEGWDKMTDLLRA